MRIPPFMIGMILTSLTAVGCHTTYVLGRNGNAPDAGSGSGGADNGGTGGVTGSGGLVGGPDGGALAKPPALDAPPTPESAGTMALQRLTASELTNTMADLLGVSPATVGAALANAGFPHDDVSSTGFLAPGAFSPLQTQALLSTAEQLAIVPNGSLASACTAPAAGAQATACATTFIRAFGGRAFRRPVTDQEAAALLDLYTTAVGFGFDFQGSLTQVVRGVLQSPHVLYHWEVGDALPSRAGALIALTAYQIASRLSYLLWQTMPDDALLAAADNNQLSTPSQILTQANRMLGDPRAQTGLANFHRQWLRVDGVESLQKDLTLYPTFNQAEAAAFGTELEKFVASTILPGGDGTLKTLLTAALTYQDNPDASAIYGGALVAAPGHVLPLNPAERAGVLTQMAFLATNATATQSDPLGRGLTVWQQLLCAPPTAATHPIFSFGPIDTTATRRDVYAQIYAQQASPPACAACHDAFDPVGLAFENYDAIGAYRTMDNGHPIDASGVTRTPGGTALSFQNAVELVNALAVNDEVKWCVTRQWFRFVLGRLEDTSDQGSMEIAYRAAAAVSGFSIRQMLMSLFQTQAFRYRAPSPGEM
jgi:Protein of unknown function (DUF1592)/Protein of unknown function (DUF1588)/Protein of unknown function (DUF1595)/Protein of unknown function (DUF1585)/Protein of unknown function (DUF1587)